MKDTLVVLGSALTAALLAVASAHPSVAAHLHPRETPVATDRAFDTILNQVELPREPIALIEVDELGNVLIPVQADALITHDGGPDGPMVSGMDIRGSRCARSVDSAMARTDGPFTVVCLPREYGLYERMNGRQAPGEEVP